MNTLQKLRQLLDRHTKRHLLWLVVFSVFVSVIEAIGISAIMPFIDIATNFEHIHQKQYYQWAFDFLNFEQDINFAIVFGLILIGFYIFRGGVNLLYSYVMAHFTENLYAQTTKKLFKIYLAMPYQTFASKNSSYLTKAIITEASLMSVVIKGVLLIISEVFVIVFIYALMLVASWKITLIFTLILIIKMLFLTQKISKKVKIAGKVRAKIQAHFYEIINRVFGNFKQVKLQNQDRLRDIKDDFSTSVDTYAKANAIYNFLREFPRIFLETSGFSLVVLLLVVLLYLNQSNVSYILPTLSLFVLALYRLLPSVNRIVSGYNELMYHHKSIDIIDEELKIVHENLHNEPIKFTHGIKLTDINFSYQDKNILSAINLTINKGEKIAFVGESGSGKSTLVDLIIGLLRPNKGEIKIDDVIINESNLQNWRSQMGYIPQQVYLFDGTIAQNVCFGRKLDLILLEKTLKQANIFDFLQSKQGLQTLVGEGGIQLSGGQKQRIAIARALYGQPEILVLDEATSALDDKTEQKIMDEIYKISKDKTLIIIAHRLSTIQGCDKTYAITNGALKQKQ
ncbi:MAG: ABC transporter ATP-binding protein [Gammaproteobacteria bacterium]|nr:ABC transporter ATP-binding protein [Gammaproteobacteria bacterium]